jgi:hypothetical protein
MLWVLFWRSSMADALLALIFQCSCLFLQRLFSRLAIVEGRRKGNSDSMASKLRSRIQDCDCGFTDSNDPTKSFFTSFLLINFTSITTHDLYNIFAISTYDIFPPNSPYARSFSPDQVQLSDAGLELTVSPSPDSKKVPCAQIFTKSATLFHGSYHGQIRVNHVPGTVTGFFSYKDDKSEIDMEYLSAWDNSTLQYSVKPQIYLANDSPSSSTRQLDTWNNRSVSFDKDFHEWSFVWLPDIVHYGLDANWSKSITTNVPTAPGRISLTQWSDGDPTFSAGPPTQNSTITISFLQAVYNDTNASPLTCINSSTVCTITNGVLQGSKASIGHGNYSTTPPSWLVVNSAHFISPAIPGCLLVLAILSWFNCRCSLWYSPFV